MLQLNPSIVFISERQPSGRCMRMQPTRLSLWRASGCLKQVSAKHQQTPGTGWGKGVSPWQTSLPARAHASGHAQPHQLTAVASFQQFRYSSNFTLHEQEGETPKHSPGSKSPCPPGLLAPVFPAEPLLQSRGTDQSLGCSPPMGQEGPARLQTCGNWHNLIWVQTQEKLHGSSKTIPDRDWCAFLSL